MKLQSSIAVVLLASVVSGGLSGGFTSAQEIAVSISLSEALNIAATENPELNAMKLYREAAEAKVRETTSDYLPRVSISAGYTRYEKDNIIVPIHEVGVFPPLDNGIYENLAQLTVPLFNGGRTSSARNAARATLQERNAQIDLVNNNLIAAIGHIFIQAQELDDRLNLIQSQIVLLNQRYQEFAILEQEGRVSPSDASLVESEIENARSDSLVIESYRRELSITLGQLLGMGKPLMPDTNVLSRSVENGQIPSTGSFSQEQTMITAPELKIADAQLNRMEALKELSVRSFWPEISGVALYNSRSGNDFDFINEWAAGIRIQVPLFDGGKRFAGIHAASASVRAAREQLNSERQKLASKMEKEQNNWETARLQNKRLKTAVRAKTTSVESQRVLYKEGRIQLSTLLTQENELLYMHVQERASLYKEMTSFLKYYSIQGTLTPNHVEQLVRRAQ